MLDWILDLVVCEANASVSQPPGSGLSRGDNAGTCHPSAPETDTENAPSLVFEKTEDGSESEEENASAEEVAKRVANNWSEHSQVRHMCVLLHEVDQPEGTEERLKCSDCSGHLVVARDVATPICDRPWTSSTINPAKEAMEHNRRVHDLKAHGVVKDESKESKGKGRQPFMHQCFGHDQQAIEGFNDCGKKLRQALAREMAERSASTESAVAVRTVQNNEVQEDDDVAELKDKDDLELESHRTDDEDEDLFHQPQFEKMGPEIRKRAKEVYKKLRSTIKEIPRPLQKREEIVVEAAVSNDNRPESFLAAHDSKHISHDRRGTPYFQKGAKSSSLLLKAVGPPLKAIEMPIPDACPSEYNFKWAVIDECWTIPTSNIEPLERTVFKDQSPWNQASRVLNKALRIGGTRVAFQEGGWVDAYSALAAVSRELKKWYTLDIVGQIATVNWLSALMFDTKWDPTLKSRYQLAGIVDSDGVLVQICYVRNKSGHNTEVARFIPDENLYTKIIEGNLEHISCICHRTKFENPEYL